VSHATVSSLTARASSGDNNETVNHRKRTTVRIGNLGLGSLKTVRCGKASGRTLHWEYGIPEYLVRHAAAIVSQAALLRYLYGLKWEQFSSGLEMHMDELRRKLDNGAAPLMRVIRGQGYLLQE
jgi:DNA-binding response OmpR family regulator